MELDEYDVKLNMEANPHIKVDLDMYKNRVLNEEYYRR